MEVSLDFLQPGVVYEGILYTDAPDADFETNPQAYDITKLDLSSDSVLTIHMARAGGFALSLRSK
jgi:hypothetical protein